jgi:UDP-N-acetylmuramate dehydrogenase
VLVNHGGGSAGELLGLAACVADAVRQRFGVALEIEPAVY